MCGELQNRKARDGVRGEGKQDRCTVRRKKGLEDESCGGCESQTDTETGSGATGQE